MAGGDTAQRRGGAVDEAADEGQDSILACLQACARLCNYIPVLIVIGLILWSNYVFVFRVVGRDQGVIGASSGGVGTRVWTGDKIAVVAVGQGSRARVSFFLFAPEDLLY